MPTGARAIGSLGFAALLVGVLALGAAVHHQFTTKAVARIRPAAAVSGDPPEGQFDETRWSVATNEASELKSHLPDERFGGKWFDRTQQLFVGIVGLTPAEQQSLAAAYPHLVLQSVKYSYNDLLEFYEAVVDATRSAPGASLATEIDAERNAVVIFGTWAEVPSLRQAVGRLPNDAVITKPALRVIAN